ncbi:MAG: hypothetical protein ABSC22_07045 [Roseiarcus sp.]|jgi:glycosyltransferase involved in cell wall biosynthesis
MTWPLLTDELDRWAQANAVATFWWRDDDAVSDTRQLDELLNCAGQAPMALAVIPGLADRSLARRLTRTPSVAVLQHGWRHANHATDGDNEYPAGRNALEVAAEFSLGRRLLADLFGPQYLPVFAPPWHGFDDSFLPLLAQAGLKAISRKGARSHSTVSGLAVANIHCVPIRWGEKPAFSSDEDYLLPILDHLEGRRCGRYDASEPTGVLTHHLVQEARSYAFMAKLVATVSGHPAARWLDPRDVFHLRMSTVAAPSNNELAAASPAAVATKPPIPVFLISFNRGAMLERAIAGLQSMAQPTQIIVHDNGSTDPTTLDVLDRLSKTGVTVVRRGSIDSPDDLNLVDVTVQDFLRDHIAGRYIVSDCDVDLGVAHPLTLTVYDELLDRFPDVECVGPMLRIRDVPRTYPLFNRLMNRHIEQFWSKTPSWAETSLGRVAYIEALIDTTLALHRAGQPFHRLKKGLRVYEPYEARHLDWYTSMDGSDNYGKTSSDNISHWNNMTERDRHVDAAIEYSSYYAVRVNNGRLERYEEKVPARED